MDTPQLRPITNRIKRNANGVVTDAKNTCEGAAGATVVGATPEGNAAKKVPNNNHKKYNPYRRNTYNPHHQSTSQRDNNEIFHSDNFDNIKLFEQGLQNHEVFPSYQEPRYKQKPSSDRSHKWYQYNKYNTRNNRGRFYGSKKRNKNTNEFSRSIGHEQQGKNNKSDESNIKSINYSSDKTKSKSRSRSQSKHEDRHHNKSQSRSRSKSVTRSKSSERYTDKSVSRSPVNSSNKNKYKRRLSNSRSKSRSRSGECKATRSQSKDKLDSRSPSNISAKHNHHSNRTRDKCKKNSKRDDPETETGVNSKENDVVISKSKKSKQNVNEADILIQEIDNRATEKEKAQDNTKADNQNQIQVRCKDIGAENASTFIVNVCNVSNNFGLDSVSNYSENIEKTDEPCVSYTLEVEPDIIIEKDEYDSTETNKSFSYAENCQIYENQQIVEQFPVATFEAQALNVEPKIAGDDTLPSSSDRPRISIIPLSRLIRNELYELSESNIAEPVEPLENAPPNVNETSGTPNKRTLRPNLVSRRRNISTGSNSSNTTETLVEKVASMDKFVIKQVINSNDTRYDEALKLQARKRLREEIRKQLKSMNLEQTKDTESINLMPDDIVDSIYIPDVVLDEIRKAFGIEIFNKNGTTMSPEAVNREQTAQENTVNSTQISTGNEATRMPENTAEATCTSDQSENITNTEESTNKANGKPFEPGQPDEPSSTNTEDINTNSQQTEIMKTQTTNKVEARSTVHLKSGINIKTPNQSAINGKTSRRNRKTICERRTSRDIVRIDLSSSSGSSASSSSSSDTESEDSARSASSSTKRHRLKLRVDAQNVVDSFEKLILPSLSENLKQRYHNKFSNSTYTRLHFISCICTSEYNSRKFAKIEIANIQRNLKTEDRTMALEFLLREIVNVFNKQKEEAKRERGRKDNNKNLVDGARPKNEATTEKGSENADSGKSKANGISAEQPKQIQSKAINNKSAHAAEKVGATGTEKNCVQSTPMRHQSANGQTAIMRTVGVDEKNAGAAKSTTPTTSTILNLLGYRSNESDYTNENLFSRQHNNAQSYTNGDSKKLAIGEPNTKDKENDKTDLNYGVRSLLQFDKLMPSKLSIDAYRPAFGEGGSVNDIGGISTYSGVSFPNIDLDALRQQNVIGEFMVNSLREIDGKLMELHQRKMFIEEIILKLQKDKMDVDMQTMKLQNEKFILLNTAMTAAASNELPNRESGVIETPSTTANQNETNSSEHAGQVQQESQPPSDNPFNRRKRKYNYKVVPIPGGTKKVRIRKPRGGKSLKADTENTSSIKNNPLQQPVSYNTKQYEYHSHPDAIPGYRPDYSDMPCITIKVKSAITQILLHDYYIIAGAEDGTIFRFNSSTLKLEKEFPKHREAISQMYLCREKKVLYTVSLDGYLKKTAIENFALDIQSVYLQEPLRCIEVQWGTAFIGGRWGNIFTYDIASNTAAEATLCSTDSSITTIVATKEGPRKVLIIASKGCEVQIRDARSGLLLRTISVPERVHTYSMLLEDGCIFCSTQRRDILKFDFTTGNHLSTLTCGNPAASMRMFRYKVLLVGCYDGYIYALDKTNGRQCGRYPGAGKVILTLAIAGNKVITSAKDKTLRVIDLPQNLVPRRFK